MKFAAALGLVLSVSVTFALAACDESPFASKEKREKKRDRDDDDDDDRPRSKASASSSAALPTRAITKGVTKVDLDLFVMSQCPYGVQAEKMFQPVLDTLGPYLNFRVDFIGSRTNGELSSMHGPSEVAGDLAQICAQAHAPKFFDLILCQNEDVKAVDTNWEACAKKLDIKTKDIAACISGPEGQKLLADSFDRSKAKSVSGSPTIMVAGEKYAGPRQATALMQQICARFSGTVPAECSSLPQSPKVNVTILRDDRCSDCDADKLEKQIAAKVPNPVITKLEYGSAEGKKLFDVIKPSALPALVFDSTLEADANALAAFKRGLRDVGPNKVLATGSWNPLCADEGGCATDECKATLLCRPEVANRLDVFVMSQCPFGVKGMNAMRDVLQNFKKAGAKVDFQVHFIGNNEPDKGLTSMHGQAEVDEDLRQVCAIKHYPANFKYMDYIWCRNNDIKSTAWESCTGGATGIDTKTIRSCAEGAEGKGLLAESFAYSKASGIGASPTWLANGKFKFSGIDPEKIKSGLCAHSKLAGCQVTLSGAPPPAAAPSAAKDSCATP